MTKSLKVLHLLRAFRVGGLERVVVDLINGLGRRGIECHVGCLIEKGEWIDRVSTAGLWEGQLGKRGSLGTILDLARYLRGQRIDLLHTHNSQAHLLGVPAALLAGIPVVHTKHGQNWPDDPWWVWKSRQVSRFTRKIVAVSDDIARIVTDIEQVPARKVVTIRNGIDLARFQGMGVRFSASGLRPPDSGLRTPDSDFRPACRRRLGIPEDAFVVGSVGRLAWEKNYELLVRAFADFHRSAPDSLLVIVGEGPYRDRIQQAAVAAEVAEACLLPGQRSEVADWLRAMDVFCLVSLTEGTSITLLEAGAAGLPCIVTDVGGNAEIVRHGISGIVVSSGNSDALVAAMKTLKADQKGREEKGRAACLRVRERYSIELMVREYTSLYERIHGGRQS